MSEIRPYNYFSSTNVYMNKAQWNTIIFDGSIPQSEIDRMIDNSNMLVVSTMTKKDHQSLIIHL